MSKVVMIWLDGFSSRYLYPQATPFIFELSQPGFSTNLEPLFAFAGIGASAFTGTKVNTHKIWCDYVLKESEGSPTIFKWLLRLCDLIPHDIMNQYARHIVYRVFRRNPGTPNLIPVELVGFFGTREQKRLTAAEPIGGITTLFDQLRRHGATYFLSGFYASIFEEQIVKRVLGALAKDYQFILFRLGSPDRLGHQYGPESDDVRRRLGKIDTIVREVITKGTQANPSLHFVVFSDHGMVPVKGHVDLLSLLERLPVKMPRDYIAFLNSTVASFWFRTEGAKGIITGELRRVKQGMILGETELKALEIDRIGYEYGELLFALKEGNVFFPDFYRRRKPPKGMHGYAFSTYDKPPFIIYSPGISYDVSQNAKARFIDVMPTILDLLNLPIPSTCEGKSLLKG